MPIEKLSVIFVFCCLVPLNNTAAGSKDPHTPLKRPPPSSSKALFASSRNNLSLKINELITPILREAAEDLYMTKLNARNSVLERAHFKTKRYVHHINPLFKNYNYLRKTECPPLPDGTRRYFCPSTDENGRWSCIKSEDLCDTVPQCPGSEDEDKKLCLFHLPVLNKLDTVSEKLGDLASMISLNMDHSVEIPSAPNTNIPFDTSIFKEAKGINEIPKEVFDILNERGLSKTRRRKYSGSHSDVHSLAGSRVTYVTKEPSIEEFANMVDEQDLNQQIQDLSSF